MLTHPQFDPVALSLGPLQIHWYGLTYLVAFVLGWLLLRRRVARAPFVQAGWSPREVEDLVFWIIVGVIVGARLGYVLFYKPGHYLANPLGAFAVWEGGMSFHGGLLGVVSALWLYGRSRGRRLLEVGDLVAPVVPLGLALGRLGNFINGELWGRVTDAALPWVMVFPQSGTMQPRHPSQLYQMALEGLLLFALLWLYARRPRRLGQVSGAFLAGYGVLRFGVEFFREPDAFLGLLALNLTMGQWLCLPMVAIGAWLWLRAPAPAGTGLGR
jgi:phosphatidylglycerol:prolipoprotein diacylglycerol transferase